MSNKKVVDDFLNKNDTAGLYKLARSKGFDPSNLIFSDLSSKITESQPKVTLYVQKSDIHGLGVFTKSKIFNKSLIEQCYAIPLEFRNKYHKDSTIMSYCYSFGNEDSLVKEHGRKLYLLTGYGLLYNHSTSPNSKWIFDSDNLVAKLIDIADIELGSEITTNYNSL